MGLRNPMMSRVCYRAWREITARIGVSAGKIFCGKGCQSRGAPDSGPVVDQSPDQWCTSFQTRGTPAPTPGVHQPLDQACGVRIVQVRGSVKGIRALVAASSSTAMRSTANCARRRWVTGRIKTGSSTTPLTWWRFPPE
jgi:hypothetical protein